MATIIVTTLGTYVSGNNPTKTVFNTVTKIPIPQLPTLPFSFPISIPISLPKPPHFPISFHIPFSFHLNLPGISLPHPPIPVLSFPIHLHLPTIPFSFPISIPISLPKPPHFPISFHIPFSFSLSLPGISLPHPPIPVLSFPISIHLPTIPFSFPISIPISLPKPPHMNTRFKIPGLPSPLPTFNLPPSYYAAHISSSFVIV